MNMATRAREAEQNIERHRRNMVACFAICGKFSLTRGERLEIASVLLDRNLDSFNDLSKAELSRVRDALEGAVLVAHIQIERRLGERR